VARGGNLLLNVGPTGDGRIPWAQAERLSSLGWWLRTNGEAIYRTRPWTRPSTTTAEGLDVRFTAAADALYAVVLGTARDESIELRDLDVDPEATIELLGTAGSRPWTTSGSGISVRLPGPPAAEPAIALRLVPPTSCR
jgi:alpha-L-fucosidase